MGGKHDTDFYAMLLREGIRPESVEILPSSYEIDDLISGKVDAFNSYLTNEPFILRRRGIDYVVINQPESLRYRLLRRYSLYHRARNR